MHGLYGKKDIQAQINEEKDRIEEEFYEDNDYEKAKNDSLTLRNEIREVVAEIKQSSAGISPEQQLLTLEYNIKGEQTKLQIERVANIYINGKKLK